MLRSRAFLSLNLAHFFDHFVLLILPTAALATGADYAGSLSPGTWAFAAFALATLPAGWLGDRWGRVAMMRVYWFGTGAACLVAGLAPGAWGLATGLALIGLFAAIYHPVATAIVMGFQERAGPRARRQRGVGQYGGGRGRAGDSAARPVGELARRFRGSRASHAGARVPLRDHPGLGADGGPDGTAGRAGRAARSAADPGLHRDQRPVRRARLHRRHHRPAQAPGRASAWGGAGAGGRARGADLRCRRLRPAAGRPPARPLGCPAAAVHDRGRQGTAAAGHGAHAGRRVRRPGAAGDAAACSARSRSRPGSWVGIWASAGGRGPTRSNICCRWGWRPAPCR